MSCLNGKPAHQYKNLTNDELTEAIRHSALGLNINELHNYIGYNDEMKIKIDKIVDKEKNVLKSLIDMNLLKEHL